MDRLAAYFHWNDKQSLDQALMVVKRRPVKMKEIERWAVAEGEKEKFLLFLQKTKREDL